MMEISINREQKIVLILLIIYSLLNNWYIALQESVNHCFVFNMFGLFVFRDQAIGSIFMFQKVNISKIWNGDVCLCENVRGRWVIRRLDYK